MGNIDRQDQPDDLMTWKAEIDIWQLHSILLKLFWPHYLVTMTNKQKERRSKTCGSQGMCRRLQGRVGRYIGFTDEAYRRGEDEKRHFIKSRTTIGGGNQSRSITNTELLIVKMP